MKIFVVLALAVACVSSTSLNAIVKPGFPEGRIINGYEAQKGEAPFIVSLKYIDHFCGGSIIDPHWVITAAHCLIYNYFSVIAGLHSRSDESDVQIRKVLGKSQFIIHEKYDGGVGPNDIGLIYFAEPFDLNALSRDGSVPVAKISLPSGKYEQTGRGKLFGWGRDNSGELPNTLQTLDADIIGYSACKAALPSNSAIADVNVCTYTAGTTDGSCNGDSGGPLVRYTADGAELVGIVSWGYNPCDYTRYPSVYTSPAAYMQWIEESVSSYTSAIADFPY